MAVTRSFVLYGFCLLCHAGHAMDNVESKPTYASERSQLDDLVRERVYTRIQEMAVQHLPTMDWARILPSDWDNLTWHPSATVNEMSVDFAEMFRQDLLSYPDQLGSLEKSGGYSDNVFLKSNNFVIKTVGTGSDEIRTLERSWDRAWAAHETGNSLIVPIVAYARPSKTFPKLGMIVMLNIYSDYWKKYVSKYRPAAADVQARAALQGFDTKGRNWFGKNWDSVEDVLSKSGNKKIRVASPFLHDLAEDVKLLDELGNFDYSLLFASEPASDGPSQLFHVGGISDWIGNPGGELPRAAFNATASQIKMLGNMFQTTYWNATAPPGRVPMYARERWSYFYARMLFEGCQQIFEEI